MFRALFCLATSSKSVSVSLWSVHPGSFFCGCGQRDMTLSGCAGKEERWCFTVWFNEEPPKETEILMLDCEWRGRCSRVFLQSADIYYPQGVNNYWEICHSRSFFLILSPGLNVLHTITHVSKLHVLQTSQYFISEILCIWAQLVWQIFENVWKTFFLTVSYPSGHLSRKQPVRDHCWIYLFWDWNLLDCFCLVVQEFL